MVEEVVQQKSEDDTRGRKSVVNSQREVHLKEGRCKSVHS